jgi:hypothetical protein
MKQQVLNLARAFVLVLVAGSAFGQTINMRANVPFEFVVSGKTLPAGHYAFSTNPAGSFLYVQSLDSGYTTIVGSGYKAENPMRQVKLVFTKYGRTYFLHQVWGGTADTRELPKTHREAALSTDYPLTSMIVPLQR